MLKAKPHSLRGSLLSIAVLVTFDSVWIRQNQSKLVFKVVKHTVQSFHPERNRFKEIIKGPKLWHLYPRALWETDHTSPSLTLAPRLHSVSMTTEYHPMMMGCYSKVAQTMEQTDYSCTCTHRWTTVLVYVQLFPSMFQTLVGLIVVISLLTSHFLPDSARSVTRY